MRLHMAIARKLAVLAVFGLGAVWVNPYSAPRRFLTINRATVASILRLAIFVNAAKGKSSESTAGLELTMT